MAHASVLNDLGNCEDGGLICRQHFSACCHAVCGALGLGLCFSLACGESRCGPNGSPPSARLPTWPVLTAALLCEPLACVFRGFS